MARRRRAHAELTRPAGGRTMIDVDHISIRFPTRTGHVDAVRDA
ncbi:ABC transporter ATP-binding protein, partial [Burkholderia cenocepacia]|nr:ABC transporter ATP-binding protein [Burkholderia cenocepacia]